MAATTDSPFKFPWMIYIFTGLLKNLEYTLTVHYARFLVKGGLARLRFYNWGNIPFEDKQGQGVS